MISLLLFDKNKIIKSVRPEIKVYNVKFML